MDRPNKIRHIKQKPKGYSQSSKFYNTMQWQRIRNTFRIHNPLCKMCSDKGIDKAGELVDHIKPVNQSNVWNTEHGKYGNPTDVRNLQTLCRACHTIKTAEDKRKGY